MSKLSSLALVALTLAASPAGAPSQPAAASTPVALTAADYTRARGLQTRFTGRARGVAGTPTWLPSGAFWYRVSVEGGHRFVIVDATAKTKTPAFDEAGVADALSRADGRNYTANTLPFSSFTFGDERRSIRFTGDEGVEWTCVLESRACTKVEAATREDRSDLVESESPDKQLVAFVRDHNIHVRAAGDATAEGRRLTTRGTVEYPYAPGGIVWSPDSRKMAASRIVKRSDRRMVRYVDSSPEDQLQPTTFERFYAKPGDALDEQERVLVDVAARRETPVDATLFPNPYNLTRMSWRDDSRAFTFEYNQRGHQVYRVIEVDAATAALTPYCRTKCLSECYL